MTKRFQNLYIQDYPVIWGHLLKIARFYPHRQVWKDFHPDSLDKAIPIKDQEGARVSVFGHATILLRTAELNVLMDPVWSENLGPFGRLGPRRQRPIIPIQSLPPIDIVLISHDHYDHLDLNALKWLVRHHNPLILTGLGVGRTIRTKLPQSRLVELGWWDSWVYKQTTINFVPAQHFSGRSLRMNSSLWGGFVIQAQREVFYYAGDTGYQEQILADIDKRFPKIDLAMIPIGSFEPYSYLKPYHLSPEDAVLLFTRLKIRKAIAVHFGTFHISLENAETQVRRFLEARKQLRSKAHDFILPEFGVDYYLERIS